MIYFQYTQCNMSSCLHGMSGLISQINNGPYSTSITQLGHETAEPQESRFIGNAESQEENFA